MGRILAIDYGKKRTGLAWTDPLQIIATGVGCVDTVDLRNKIQDLMRENIERIVLGYPTRLDGSDSHVTGEVRSLQKWFNKNFPNLQVLLRDERFTSVMAERAMIQGGVKKKKRKEKELINEVSATLLLQDYLQEIQG